MAASAAAQALSELETRWRPLRLELDAEVAGWLLGAEQSYAAKLSGGPMQESVSFRCRR